jgi:DNA-binding LacI/PurR family transcriptional regulator
MSDGATAPAAAPTSRDVARLAGVSQKTVSRVLNDEPYVTPELRSRVLEAAATLGYRLNSAARALASGRSRSIGVISLGTDASGPPRILVGLERAARAAGYSLRVVFTVEGDANSLVEAVHTLLIQGVDGMVISEPIDEGGAPIRLEVPVLAFGTAPSFLAPRVLRGGVSSEALARAATEHLLDLGHATVHHISGPMRWFASRERAAGWRGALEERGRAVPPILEGDWSPASGYRAGQELAEREDVTAVFVASDEMAIGAMRALHEAGRDIPRDISVIGFDDMPFSAYATPPLTTVRHPFDDAARDAIRLLVQTIEDPDGNAPAIPERPAELVVRASTARPRHA